MSNFIILKAGHPLLIIRKEDRPEYIESLRQIRTERTDEHLVSFFFRTAMRRMGEEISQKRHLTDDITAFMEPEVKKNKKFIIK